MKNNILFLILLYMGGVNQTISAQGPATAYDFNMNDCNGKMHHLFGELDSGNVVVMEFFMISCSPCIVAGHALDEMVVPLKKKYGEKVRFYQIGFTKSYTCSQIKDWVSTNGFATSVPFDSGDVQVAYYGGMGMPTVAVAGGKGHDVLFSSIDFKPNTDTATIAASIHAFFNTTGIQKNEFDNVSLSFFPNPASSTIDLTFNSEEVGTLHLSIRNLQGKKIADLLNENIKPGVWNKTIFLPQLKNGIYLLEGETGSKSFAKKITILNP